MKLSRLWQVTACAIAAALLTAGAVALDFQRAGVQQTLTGLNWAHQVASQVEGMVLRAREAGEKDPLGWAVNYLSQGNEPRLMRITRIAALEAGERAETYGYDRVTGEFAYTHPIAGVEDAAIRVQLTLGFLGFLGARSEATSDLLTLTLFALGFTLLFLRTGRLFGFDDARRLRSLVTEWVRSAKSQLTRHGGHVREVVRESQRLAVCSARSRDQVGALRAKLHEGLTELHGSREFYREGEEIATRAETLALNMAIEANRLGGDARRIADQATELHRRIQALHRVNRQGQALVQGIERRLEPWTVDADLAYHAFDDVKLATESLGRHIRSTTESLLGQAKLIQGLNQNLGAQDATSREGAPPAAPAAAQGALPRLPDPLPPLDDKEARPLFRRGKKTA